MEGWAVLELRDLVKKFMGLVRISVRYGQGRKELKSKTGREAAQLKIR